MHANGGAIDSKLQPEAALIAIEKGGNADQKGDDTYAWASQYAVMNDPCQVMQKQTALHIMKRRF